MLAAMVLACSPENQSSGLARKSRARVAGQAGSERVDRISSASAAGKGRFIAGLRAGCYSSNGVTCRGGLYRIGWPGTKLFRAGGRRRLRRLETGGDFLVSA